MVSRHKKKLRWRRKRNLRSDFKRTYRVKRTRSRYTRSTKSRAPTNRRRQYKADRGAAKRLRRQDQRVQERTSFAKIGPPQPWRLDNYGPSVRDVKWDPVLKLWRNKEGAAWADSNTRRREERKPTFVKPSYYFMDADNYVALNRPRPKEKNTKEMKGFSKVVAPMKNMTGAVQQPPDWESMGDQQKQYWADMYGDVRPRKDLPSGRASRKPGPPKEHEGLK